ncbi:hypothetical protein LCL97_24165 [Seohaeicola saemankumensis]|nr:hypothetical protein [Seohaeicola saemankumensis]MCA0873933.1 hypothetical protein [Seohaeicola saemankumensis]
MTNATTNVDGGGKKSGAVKSFFNLFRKNRPAPAAQAAPAATANTDDVNVVEAFHEKNWGNILKALKNYNGPAEEKRLACSMMLATGEGIEAMARDKELAAWVLSICKASDLQSSMFFDMMGDKAEDLLVPALLRIVQKSAPPEDSIEDDPTRFDKDLFKVIAEHVSVDTWNGTGKGLGSDPKALGPSIFTELVKKGHFDSVSDLIDVGADTTIAAPAVKGLYSYSGFSPPLQHMLFEELPLVGKLGTEKEEEMSDKDREKAINIRMILNKLEDDKTALGLTNWKDIKDSELIAAFREEPGTIWGFEKMRTPFVAASHEEESGVRPARMMELWDAINPITKEAAYAKFLADPKNEIPILVEAAVKAAKDGIQKVRDSGDKVDPLYFKFRPFVEVEKEYIANLKVDAKKYLESLAEQMPRGSMARESEDVQKFVGKSPKTHQATVSDVAGVDDEKFMTSFLCKAGLWSAKTAGKPVYYVLDGINMDDVVDYKKIKYKAIEDFLDAGGADENAPSFHEVITMKEVCEILKNWKDLKFEDGKHAGEDVVKFVRKGSIMSPKEAKKFVQEWEAKRDAAAKNATGDRLRRPAPGRVPDPENGDRKVLAYAKELAKIDPGLPQKLDDELAKDTEKEKRDKKEKIIDMDARDIVRKAGYLVRVSNTRPEYVVKYLAAKCDILVSYGVVPQDLVDVAATLGKLVYSNKTHRSSAVKAAAAKVESAIKGCAPALQGPLSQSLVRTPVLKFSDDMKRMAGVI